MRSMFRSLAAVAAVVAFSGAAYAGQTAKPAAKTAATKPAKAAKATAITATGTVSKFDAASNTLTVTTAKGDANFVLDSSASVTSNGKKVMASDLSSQVGHRVTVRYTESGGQKMAQSVRVSAGAGGAKTASATKKPAGSTKKS